MASPTQWTWVWVDSGSWWWTGRPGVLRFMGSQRVRHDWVTKLNWSENLLILLSQCLTLVPSFPYLSSEFQLKPADAPAWTMTATASFLSVPANLAQSCWLGCHVTAISKTLIPFFLLSKWCAYLVEALLHVVPACPSLTQVHGTTACLSQTWRILSGFSLPFKILLIFASSTTSYTFYFTSHNNIFHLVFKSFEYFSDPCI